MVIAVIRVLWQTQEPPMDVGEGLRFSVYYTNGYIYMPLLMYFKWSRNLIIYQAFYCLVSASCNDASYILALQCTTIPFVPLRWSPASHMNNSRISKIYNGWNRNLWISNYYGYCITNILKAWPSGTCRMS